MTTDKISWIESDQYYPITLQALDKKIEELKKDIENLTAEKEELKKKYECVRSILYLKDEELKKAVAKIFSDFWSLKISHMDKTKSAEFRENILIEDNGRDILVKIKGTHEDYPSIKFITENRRGRCPGCKLRPGEKSQGKKFSICGRQRAA